MDGDRNASSLRWIQRGLLSLCLIVPGCGWLGGESEEQVDNDVVIPGLDELEGSEQNEAAGEPVPVAPEGRNLALKVNVGDRFPLQKTVQQSVVQSSADGNLTSESLLEMMLEINVEEVQPDRTRMQVRYHRIRYYQNVDGERIVYDSEKDTGPLHPSVAAYHGMVNNGFSFWIGPQNGIQELVGFEDFLKRCFRSIPPAERQAALNRIASSTGDQGVANFIDDSIGLLPYGAEEESDGKSGVAAGDVWTRARKVELPLPMQLSDKCLISDLNDKIATIDIHGTIGPVTNAVGPAGPDQQPMQVEIRGGNSTGQCLIDRNSGLPIQSRIERVIDMNVRLLDGEQFTQQKQIITTIRAFPSTPVSKPIEIGSAGSARRPAAVASETNDPNISQVNTTDADAPEVFPGLDEAGEINARPIGNSTPPSNRQRPTNRERQRAVRDIDIEAE